MAKDSQTIETKELEITSKPVEAQEQELQNSPQMKLSAGQPKTDHVGEMMQATGPHPQPASLFAAIGEKIKDLFEGDQTRLIDFAEELKMKANELAAGPMAGADGVAKPQGTSEAGGPKFEGRDPGTIGMRVGAAPNTTHEEAGMPAPKPLNETGEYILEKHPEMKVEEVNSKTAPGSNV